MRIRGLDVRRRSRVVALWRQWRASWRDTALLLRQFGAPLTAFALIVVGGGLAYHALSIRAGEPVDSAVEAIYLALLLVFLQSSGEFPHVWYLQVFYFALSVLGLGVLAQARAMNPAIQVIVRIFDDDFANALQNQFNFKALSATSMAAPAFAAAAVGVDVTRPITVEGQALSFARMSVGAASPLAGRSILEVEQQYDLSVVFWRRAGESDFHPLPSQRLASHDAIAVVGKPECIHRLVRENQS